MSERSGPASVRFDVGRPDHLRPLLGFVDDQPSKVGGRADKLAAVPFVILQIFQQLDGRTDCCLVAGVIVTARSGPTLW